MTRPPLDSSLHVDRGAAAWVLLVATSLSLFCATPLPAQQRGNVHYRHHTSMPPGTIGRDQLRRGGPLPGYMQPIDIRVPTGAKVALHVQGRFEALQPGPVLVGMLIGPVYRLKVTGIPKHEGLEIYPTIEVINRLYPPLRLATRFPIPIEISAEDLQYALSGQFVTRVIYLEDPETALPIREDPEQQFYFDVGRRQDPLRVADQLGRPMAILRMGSRIPSANAADRGFAYGSPPVLKLRRPAEPPKPVNPKENKPAPGKAGPPLPSGKSSHRSIFPSRIFTLRPDAKGIQR